MTNKTKLLPFFFLALTILFSAWNVFAKETTFCLTEACQVFDDFTFLGISLWLYSFVFSMITLNLLSLGKINLVRNLLALALIADSLLLMLMMITAPCFNCLIVACLYALSFGALYFREKKESMKIIFIVWSLLFIVNVGGLVKNMVSPYSIYVNPLHQKKFENPQNATMRIYFSPSCTSCREIVNLLGSLERTQQGDIAWFPVAENEEDIVLIRQMENYILQGDNLKEALEKTLENPEKATFSNFFVDFIMQCRVLINQSHLNQAGTSRIPFVEYTGLPAHLSQQAMSTSPTEEVDMLEKLRLLSPEALPSNKSSNQNNLPLNFGVSAFCDSSSEEPCD